MVVKFAYPALSQPDAVRAQLLVRDATQEKVFGAYDQAFALS